MNRFPVLRLPYLALKEVIESTDKTDVLNLGLASKKTYRLIETTRNTISMKRMSQEDIDKLGVMDRYNLARLEKLHSSENVTQTLDVEFTNHLLLAIETSYSEDNIKKSMILRVFIESIDDRPEENPKKRIGKLNVEVFIPSNDTVHTVWVEIGFGFRYLVHHFFNSFKLKKISELLIDPGQVSSSHKLWVMIRVIIDFVKKLLSRNLNGPNIRIANFGLIDNQNLKYIFDGVKYGRIVLLGQRRHNQNPENIVYDSETLFIEISDWFTLENLINTKCELHLLHKTVLTNTTMKEFFKNWMDGRLQRRLCLSAELREDVDTEVILSVLTNR
ncbi:unnamed protein product [Caenorhabditis brenneri]